MIYSFEQASEMFEKHLTQTQWFKTPESLYLPINYILSLKGKRVRPALVIMGTNLFQGEVKSAMNAALSIEVFHNFTLLHDDIMDNADIRRGKPVANKIWGNNASILSGDAMLIEAYKCLNTYSTLPEFAPLICSFSETALDVCKGQQYDMNFETQNEVSETEYIEMIRLKTAVLLAQSLRMGGIIANASEQDIELLSQFGENIGIAFQLRDDLLDVYSDTVKFGKMKGGDILANKKTFLHIAAREASDKTQKAEIEHWYNQTDVEPQEKIDAVTALFNQLNVVKICQCRIEEYSQKAFEALSRISVQQEHKRPLIELADQMMNRES